jgi:head-tail adaptor
MSWQVPKLNRRIQIQTRTETPNSDGGFTYSYVTLATIWSRIKPLGEFRKYVQALRSQQLLETSTHEFLVRRSSLVHTISSDSYTGMGREYTTAFATSFDSILDINHIKVDHFIFLNEGSSIKGRLFKVTGIQLDDDRREMVKISAEEIEERGTGYNE